MPSAQLVLFCFPFLVFFFLEILFNEAYKKTRERQASFLRPARFPQRNRAGLTSEFCRLSYPAPILNFTIENQTSLPFLHTELLGGGGRGRRARESGPLNRISRRLNLPQSHRVLWCDPPGRFPEALKYLPGAKLCV